MNDMQVGRNDPCPCGSGKKFKKCCLQARSSYPTASPARFAQQAARSSFARSGGAVNARNGPPPRLAGLFDHLPPPSTDHDMDAPEPRTVPVLPVEVGLHYTFPEPFGLAEVTFIFPAGKNFLLENDDTILVEDLKPGDRVILKDDQIATITEVKLYYEPPDPPTVGENGRVLSRVIGTIKHKGPEVVDVKWPGYTATSSPEHPYFSVSRQAYVPANKLEVGELLRTDDNLVAPVQNVSEPRYGMIDLYNIEVEHFHNYYVGPSEGNAVLVHNGASGAGGYINTPKEVTIRNKDLAGKTHPVSGIPFDAHGFPDFSSVATQTVKIKFTGSRPADFAAANKAAGLAEKPLGFTWHHHQDGTTMQLVPWQIHRDTGHTGGFALNPVIPGG